jgi:polyvinyl alcohol dehydrogenase (cytochrome)
MPRWKRSSRPRGDLLALIVLIAALSPALGRAADWQMSGNDLSNDRNQPRESLIGVNNVGSLKPVWTFKTLGSVSATPLIAGGFVYVPDWGGGLHKLDAKTGRVAWSRKISDYTGWADSVSRTTPVLANGVLVVAQQPQSFGAKHDSSYLLGLKPETGDLLWKVKLDKHPATILTQSPVIYDGMIYIGTSSNEEHWAMETTYACCSFVARMNAIDVKTGRLVWQTPMVPDGYTGAAIWSSTPAIDPKRGMVYITTGNNYSTPEGVAQCEQSGRRDCLPVDDHIDSFLALDLKTGSIKWGTRLTPFDTWNGNCFVDAPGLGTCPEPRGGDLDFGDGAMLYTAVIEGKPHDLLAAGQKSGMFWGIDRDTGQVLWSTLVGPGGQSGGVEWGSATDGKRLYVAITNSAFQDWTMQPSGIIATGGMWSVLDPATGKILWQTAEPTGSWAFGPVSVANGVVYAGSMDPKGYMRALDAVSGKILWSFASGGSVASGPAIVDGMIFWGSGYEHLNSPTDRQSVGNDLFYAFAPESETGQRP